MEILTILTFFLLGVILGTCFVVVTTILIGKFILNKDKNQTTKKPESVNDRMKRVKVITEKQLDLQNIAQGPQKNAMHGRHKNSLIESIKELEIEKDKILRSILADGFDPHVTIIDETGSIINIKLSKLMEQNSITMPPKQEPAKSVPSTKQVGKFTVHKGGKDDDGGETVH